MKPSIETAVTIKFEHSFEQEIDHIVRVMGMVRIKNFIDILEVVDLDANPRSARVGSVTDAIAESIEKTPDIFPLKTKGILLASAKYTRRDRGRYEISVVEPRLEGILDGGHNSLEIGRLLLRVAGVNEKDIRGAKNWLAFRDLWNAQSEALRALKTRVKAQQDVAPELDVLVPVELIVPSEPEDPIAVDAFNDSLIAICSARNNNVQLRIEAKANQAGYFDYLKEVLQKDVSQNVEWKTNEGGKIKVGDIVALAWVPLGVVEELPKDSEEREVSAPVPQNLYRSKGDCVSRFERLMSSQEVFPPGQTAKVPASISVKSALDVAVKMPQLFDYIYANVPGLYNSEASGKWGRITANKKMNQNSKIQHVTPFTGTNVEWRVPEGFIWPYVYGLRALLEVDGETVRWKVDPADFLKKHLAEIVPQISLFMAPLDYDPQKFGKSIEVYRLAQNVFESVLRRANH